MVRHFPLRPVCYAREEAEAFKDHSSRAKRVGSREGIKPQKLNNNPTDSMGFVMSDEESKWGSLDWDAATSVGFFRW